MTPCTPPLIAGRKTYLFAFIDDHSRMLVGYRWGLAEDTVRLAAALRPALASRGVPEAIYVDNGSAFVDRWLLGACARLGIRLTHSTPGRPQGRGKIERFFRTVNDQFLIEVAPSLAAAHHGEDVHEDDIRISESITGPGVDVRAGLAALNTWCTCPTPPSACAGCTPTS